MPLPLLPPEVLLKPPPGEVVFELLDPAPVPDVELPGLGPVPAPVPEVELPEDDVPVEPAPATPSVLVTLPLVATTTVCVPDAVVAVTVDPEPEASAPRNGELPGSGFSIKWVRRTPTERISSIDNVLGALLRARLHGTVANAITEVHVGAQTFGVGRGTAVYVVQHTLDTVLLDQVSKC